MFIVIFEVQPKKGLTQDYLDLAKQLKPKLEAIDGFIDNERFASQRAEGRVLSLSTWRDEKSVVRWRTHGEHHGVQEKGRFQVFENYRIRVGEITFDDVPPKGLSVREQRFDATEIGEAKSCTITEVSPRGDAGQGLDRGSLAKRLDPGAEGLVDHELYESIYNPGKLAILASWRDDRVAAAWKPAPFDGAGAVRHRRVRVIRDYGMFERREAPQYYPEVER